MSGTDWQGVLQELNRCALKDPFLRRKLPAEVVARGWCGGEGASSESIADLERRLGCMLPPSYRDFLLTSDGWWGLGIDWYRAWPSSDVEWFRVRHRWWIEAYSKLMHLPIPFSEEAYRDYECEPNCLYWKAEHLPFCLEVTDKGEDEIVLLNPQVVRADGEWEAWRFGNKIPGAVRYASFRDVVEQGLRDWREILEEERLAD